MKEKFKQKGFIQIPLLVFIIALIIAASVGTGIVLYKQGKIKLTADVSEILKEKEIQPTPEEMASAEVPTTADLSIPEQSPVSVPISENPAASPEPIIEARPAPVPVVSTPAPTPAATPSPEIQEIKAKVEQINEEQIRFNAEQIRQSRCITLSSLKEQIQKLCHSYYFVELDRCIQIREKDVQLLKDYIPNDEQRKTGQDESYYAARIQEEQDKVDQMIALKPQYESLKAECGQ